MQGRVSAEGTHRAMAALRGLTEGCDTGCTDSSFNDVTTSAASNAPVGRGEIQQHEPDEWGIPLHKCNERSPSLQAEDWLHAV